MTELNGSKNATSNHETIKYKRVYWVQSFIFFPSNFLKSSFNSFFLLSPMVILLWQKTILSRFKVFPFMASPDSWLTSLTFVSATSIPFYRNRILFSSSYTTSFFYLVNSSFTLASFICFSTFLCGSRNALYPSLAFHTISTSPGWLYFFQCLFFQW